MKSDIISDLYTVYTSELKGYIYAGIPVLIISILSGVYTFSSFTTVFTTAWGVVYSPIWIPLQFLAVGLIATDEFEGARFVILGRVSTRDQLNNADFEDRLQPIRELAVQEQEGRVVKEFTGSESGATMDRDSLDEILEMAESNQFDVLAVRNVDRLSRADPWDTINYLLDLRKAGITLYEHPGRFFDWDNLNDFQLLSQRMFFSREWYERLAEGRREGVFRHLKKGKWPLQAHFGYETDENRDGSDRNIYLDDSKGEILYKIFDIYEQTGNISETQRKINTRFKDDLDGELSYGRLRTVLSSKLCIGQLSYEGVVQNEIRDLKAVPKAKFENVQSILASTSRESPDKIPEPIVDATTKFGIKYVHSILEQISFRRCKNCGGELTPYSKMEIWGIPVEKVRCESCDYDGPLISEKEFMEIHMTAPLSCPFCYETGDFEISESTHGLEMYEYDCKNCDHQFHTSVRPGKIKRFLNNPGMGIDFNKLMEQEQAQSDQKYQPSSNESDKKQITLSDL